MQTKHGLQYRQDNTTEKCYSAIWTSTMTILYKDLITLPQKLLSQYRTVNFIQLRLKTQQQQFSLCTVKTQKVCSNRTKITIIIIFIFTLSRI